MNFSIMNNLEIEFTEGKNATISLRKINQPTKNFKLRALMLKFIRFGYTCLSIYIDNYCDMAFLDYL